MKDGLDSIMDEDGAMRINFKLAVTVPVVRVLYLPSSQLCQSVLGLPLCKPSKLRVDRIRMSLR